MGKVFVTRRPALVTEMMSSRPTVDMVRSMAIFSGGNCPDWEKSHCATQKSHRNARMAVVPTSRARRATLIVRLALMNWRRARRTMCLIAITTIVHPAQSQQAKPAEPKVAAANQAVLSQLPFSAFEGSLRRVWGQGRSHIFCSRRRGSLCLDPPPPDLLISVSSSKADSFYYQMCY